MLYYLGWIIVATLTERRALRKTLNSIQYDKGRLLP